MPLQIVRACPAARVAGARRDPGGSAAGAAPTWPLRWPC